MRKHNEATDVLPPDVITLAQLFNGSIEETFFSATYQVDIFLRIADSNLSPLQTCSMDVVVASSIASLSAQPAGGLADLPIPTNLDTTTRTWLVNSSSNVPQTATLFLRRLVGATTLVAPERFKFVLIRSNESCQATNVIQATAASMGVKAYYSESVSNVLIKVQLAVPSQSGLYILCGGKESSNTSTTTTTTAMLSLGKMRCLENEPPAYVIPPLSWLSPNTVPSSGASPSWTVTFVGNALLSVATDSAAVCLPSTYNPLVQSAVGRVAWTVPLEPGAVIALCYRRGSSPDGWVDVPFYYALDAFTIDRLNENVTPPWPQPGGGGGSGGTTPLTTTPVPPPTTSTPLPTSPAPTIPGGCATASAAAIASFGSNSAINFRTSGPWPLQVAASFASFLSTKLCVSINSISLVQIRINSVWDIQCVVYAAGGGSGAYSGSERMAYTVFVLYYEVWQQLWYNYGVYRCFPATKIDDGSTASDDSPIAQLIVGVAVAAVVCAVVCLCGLGYLCCKRMRQANGENHRHNAANAAPHVAQEGITVIPRSAVIQSHARVVLGTRVPRLHDRNGSSTDSGDSDDARSTATGHVVDVEEHQLAATPPAGDDGSINCDPSVYGPDATDQRPEYLPRTASKDYMTSNGAACQPPGKAKQEDALNPRVASNALDATRNVPSVSRLSPISVSTAGAQELVVAHQANRVQYQGNGDEIEMVEIRGGGNDRHQGEREEGSGVHSPSGGTMTTSIVVGSPPERSTRRTRPGDQSGVDMC